MLIVIRRIILILLFYVASCLLMFGFMVIVMPVCIGVISYSGDQVCIFQLKITVLQT
jgi:hypothetical protein